MAEQLRWDHDRMVGESYTDYAARMRGLARAAEIDRDKAQAEQERLRAELPEVQCPACGATIRARMSDAEGRARDEAAVSAIPAITRIRQGATRAGHVLVSPDDLAVLDRLIHAYRAHREVGPGACCDLHGRNCEPPSELCCRECTEGAHPQHADGSTWSSVVLPALAGALADVAELVGLHRETDEPDLIVERVRETTQACEQRITGLQAEFRRQDQARDRQLEQLRAQRDATLELHRRDIDGGCTTCRVPPPSTPPRWPCPTARALGVES